MDRQAIGALCALGILGSFTTARAESPPLIPIQGFLTDQAGAPIGGEHRITLSIYDAESNGDLLHTDDFLSIEVINGAFTVFLGGKEAFDLSMFAEHDDLWLETVIDGTEIVQPRTRLGTVPYAAYATAAGDAATVGGVSADDLMSMIPTGEAIEDAALAACFDSEAELTAALDDNYKAASYEPDYRQVPTDLMVRHGTRALSLRTDGTNSYISTKADFVGNGAEGGTPLLIVGGGGISLRTGDDGCCGTRESFSIQADGAAYMEGVRLFQKGGNNGTVSCDTFCNGAVWGTTGSCVGQRRADNGDYLPCSTVAGTGVVCMCSRMQ